MDFPLLRNLTEKDLKDKRVILRLDLNVPIKDGVAHDDFRIKKVLPTIEFLKKSARSVFVISHHSDSSQTLRPVASYLEKHFAIEFIEGTEKHDVALSSRKAGTIFLCENLRFYKGEKANDPVFVEQLARWGDVYVNEAFSASHREHASIVGLPRVLPAYAGFLFEEEVKHLSEAFSPPHPFLFILGGNKVSTKLPLAKKFLGKADSIFIGGALANDFFSALGYEVGLSVCGEEMVCVETPRETEGLLGHKSIILPRDVVVRSGEETLVRLPSGVLPHEKILDAGPEALEELQRLVKEARFILWNGPLGEYTDPRFKKASVALMNMIAKSHAESVVGGGDTVVLISEAGLLEKFSFVSTAGGAMLEFLGMETLPGIEALRAAELCRLHAK